MRGSGGGGVGASGFGRWSRLALWGCRALEATTALEAATIRYGQLGKRHRATNRQLLFLFCLGSGNGPVGCPEYSRLLSVSNRYGFQSTGCL